MGFYEDYKRYSSGNNKERDLLVANLIQQMKDSGEYDKIKSAVHEEIASGKSTGGKVFNWVLAMNPQALNPSYTPDKVHSDPVGMLTEGIVYKVAEMGAELYTDAKRVGMDDKKAGEYANMKLFSDVSGNKSVMKSLTEPGSIGQMLTSITRLDENGKPLTYIPNTNMSFATKLDQDLDAGSSFSAFVRNATGKTLIGSLATKMIDYVSGNSPSFFTNYKQAAIQENLQLGKEEAMLGKTGRIISTGLGYTASIIENYYAARTAKLGSFGIFGLNVAKARLIEYEDATGMSERFDSKKWLHGLVYDAVTTGIGVVYSQKLALRILGAVGSPDGTGALSSLLKAYGVNTLSRAALFPAVNIGVNTAVDMAIDYSFHRIAKNALGVEFAQQTDARYTLDFSTSEASKESAKKLLSEMMFRSAMVVGSGLFRNYIAGTASNNQEIASRAWFDRLSNENLHVSKAHPMLTKFLNGVGAMTWKLYPGNIKAVDQILRSPHSRQTFEKLLAGDQQLTTEQYIALWSKAEYLSNNAYRWFVSKGGISPVINADRFGLLISSNFIEDTSTALSGLSRLGEMSISNDAEVDNLRTALSSYITSKTGTQATIETDTVEAFNNIAAVLSKLSIREGDGAPGDIQTKVQFMWSTLIRDAADALPADRRAPVTDILMSARKQSPDKMNSVANKEYSAILDAISKADVPIGILPSVKESMQKDIVKAIQSIEYAENDPLRSLFYVWGEGDLVEKDKFLPKAILQEFQNVLASNQKLAYPDLLVKLGNASGKILMSLEDSITKTLIDPAIASENKLRYLVEIRDTQEELLNGFYKFADVSTVSAYKQKRAQSQGILARHKVIDEKLRGAVNFMFDSLTKFDRVGLAKNAFNPFMALDDEVLSSLGLKDLLTSVRSGRTVDDNVLAITYMILNGSTPYTYYSKKGENRVKIDGVTQDADDYLESLSNGHRVWLEYASRERSTDSPTEVNTASLNRFFGLLATKYVDTVFYRWLGSAGSTNGTPEAMLNNFRRDFNTTIRANYGSGFFEKLGFNVTLDMDGTVNLEMSGGKFKESFDVQKDVVQRMMSIFNNYVAPPSIRYQNKANMGGDIIQVSKGSKQQQMSTDDVLKHFSGKYAGFVSAIKAIYTATFYDQKILNPGNIYADDPALAAEFQGGLKNLMIGIDPSFRMSDAEMRRFTILALPKALTVTEEMSVAVTKVVEDLTTKLSYTTTVIPETIGRYSVIKVSPDTAKEVDSTEVAAVMEKLGYIFLANTGSTNSIQLYVKLPVGKDSAIEDINTFLKREQMIWDNVPILLKESNGVNLSGRSRHYLFSGLMDSATSEQIVSALDASFTSGVSHARYGNTQEYISSLRKAYNSYFDGIKKANTSKEVYEVLFDAMHALDKLTKTGAVSAATSPSKVDKAIKGLYDPIVDLFSDANKMVRTLIDPTQPLGNEYFAVLSKIPALAGLSDLVQKGLNAFTLQAAQQQDAQQQTPLSKTDAGIEIDNFFNNNIVPFIHVGKLKEAREKFFIGVNDEPILEIKFFTFAKLLPYLVDIDAPAADAGFRNLFNVVVNNLNSAWSDPGVDNAFSTGAANLKASLGTLDSVVEGRVDAAIRLYDAAYKTIVSTMRTNAPLTVNEGLGYILDASKASPTDKVRHSVLAVLTDGASLSVEPDKLAKRFSGLIKDFVISNDTVDGIINSLGASVRRANSVIEITYSPEGLGGASKDAGVLSIRQDLYDELARVMPEIRGSDIRMLESYWKVNTHPVRDEGNTPLIQVPSDNLKLMSPLAREWIRTAGSMSAGKIMGDRDATLRSFLQGISLQSTTSPGITNGTPPLSASAYNAGAGSLFSNTMSYVKMEDLENSRVTSMKEHLNKYVSAYRRGQEQKTYNTVLVHDHANNLSQRIQLNAPTKHANIDMQDELGQVSRVISNPSEMSFTELGLMKFVYAYSTSADEIPQNIRALAQEIADEYRSGTPAHAISAVERKNRAVTILDYLSGLKDISPIRKLIVNGKDYYIATAIRFSNDSIGHVVPAFVTSIRDMVNGDEIGVNDAWAKMQGADFDKDPAQVYGISKDGLAKFLVASASNPAEREQLKESIGDSVATAKGTNDEALFNRLLLRQSYAFKHIAEHGRDAKKFVGPATQPLIDSDLALLSPTVISMFNKLSLAEALIENGMNQIDVFYRMSMFSEASKESGAGIIDFSKLFAAIDEGGRPFHSKGIIKSSENSLIFAKLKDGSVTSGGEYRAKVIGSMLRVAGGDMANGMRYAITKLGGVNQYGLVIYDPGDMSTMMMSRARAIFVADNLDTVRNYHAMINSASTTDGAMQQINTLRGVAKNIDPTDIHVGMRDLLPQRVSETFVNYVSSKDGHKQLARFLGVADNEKMVSVLGEFLKDMYAASSTGMALFKNAGRDAVISLPYNILAEFNEYASKTIDITSMLPPNPLITPLLSMMKAAITDTGGTISPEFNTSVIGIIRGKIDSSYSQAKIVDAINRAGYVDNNLAESDDMNAFKSNLDSVFTNKEYLPPQVRNAIEFAYALSTDPAKQLSVAAPKSVRDRYAPATFTPSSFLPTKSDIEKNEKLFTAVALIDDLLNRFPIAADINYGLRKIAEHSSKETILLASTKVTDTDSLIETIYDTIKANPLLSSHTVTASDVENFVRGMGFEVSNGAVRGVSRTFSGAFNPLFVSKIKPGAKEISTLQAGRMAALKIGQKDATVNTLVANMIKINISASPIDKITNRVMFTALVDNIDDMSSTLVLMASKGLTGNIASSLSGAIDRNGIDYMLNAEKVRQVEFIKINEYNDLLLKSYIDKKMVTLPQFDRNGAC